jgi:glucose-6-phosphate 1-epimerase
MATASKKPKSAGDGVREIELPGDDGFVCQAVELVKGDSRVVVHLHGATLTSWTYKSEELIFLRYVFFTLALHLQSRSLKRSDKTVYNGKKALRGGIPLVFPKFGAWELGPNHGFARISAWRLASSSAADLDEINASFELVANAETKALWNYDFKLTYVVSLSSDSLTTTLVVDNLGDTAFEFETLLHTYFRVPDITKVKIQGLGGAMYRDQVGVLLTRPSFRLTVHAVGSAT